MSDSTYELERFTALKLPTGVQEFHEWAESFITIYGDALPTQHVDSIKFALASQIMHLGEATAFASRDEFYNRLVAGAAKQVAHHVFTEIKLKQQAAIKAAEEEAKKANEQQVTSL